jgi:hypothetical protein
MRVFDLKYKFIGISGFTEIRAGIIMAMIREQLKTVFWITRGSFRKR